MAWDMPVSLADFWRIECDRRDGPRHYVVHAGAPRCSLEFTPDRAAPDRIGRGLIRRICVPNSWAGDYHQYAKLMDAAQDFFAQSFAEPVPKAETRRFHT